MQLTVDQRQTVRAVAHRIGWPLKYQPKAEDAGAMLRYLIDYSLAMAATSTTPRERDRWNREVIRVRQALEGKGRYN
ncbi:MAG: hypothetical protein ACYCSN_13520 [Acidobacteriaceae bacterium]